MYRPQQNQLKSHWLNCEGAAALQFDEVMNVKYDNFTVAQPAYWEKLTLENFYSVKASII